jgi:hypothetical protein
MNDTTAAPPVDDIWATKHPELVAGRGYAWSPKAKPLGSRLAFMRIAIFGYMALQVGAMLILVGMLYIFQQLEVGADTTGPMFGVIGGIVAVGGTYLMPASIAVYLACIVAYLMFVYRGMKNLHLSDARSVTISPAWAVGWSFIPFANFVMILTVMRELWIGSHDPVSGKYNPPATIIVWWVTYLAFLFSSRISDALVPKDTDLQFLDPSGYLAAFMPSVAVGMASGVCLIISCFCLLAIVKQITAAQDSLRSTSAFDE